MNKFQLNRIQRLRKIFIVLTLMLMVVACHHSDRNKLTGNVQEAVKNTNTIQNKPERLALIEELKKLRRVIASNDKEKISIIFQFPLSDSSFNIYVDDSTYNEQFKSNSNKITKAMFMQYFKEISAGIWLYRVNNLFNYINLDSLSEKDFLKYDEFIKTEFCYYSYEIEVVKNYVTLRINSKANENYKSKELSDDSIPENSSEICEHNFWWVFRFDGEKLHLENISGAD